MKVLYSYYIEKISLNKLLSSKMQNKIYQLRIKFSFIFNT